MPSSISHAIAAVTVAAATMPRRSWRAVAVVGAVCAVAPDVDALPRLIGRTDFSILGGHRGITHSISFALALAGIVALVTSQRLGAPRWRVFTYLALATLSHGVLDSFTDYGGGEGVAFLSPFSNDRYLAGWRPIAGEFSELLFCLLPLTLIIIGTLRWRKIPLGLKFREGPIQLRLGRTETQARGDMRS